MSIQENAAVYWTEKRIKSQIGAKKIIFHPVESAPLLYEIGLMNKDGSFSRDHMRKYIQTNHMVQLLCKPIQDLQKKTQKIVIVDLACGNSYLTICLAWYLTKILRYPCQIFGIDHKESLIEKSRTTSHRLGLNDCLIFNQSTLESFKPENFDITEAHLVTALHACNTATDWALAIATRMDADYIAVAPCCQAELSEKWSKMGEKSLQSPLKALFKTPQIRRSVASDVTDTFRMLLLRAKGYVVNATEFVPSEHTPKNRLLLAEKKGGHFSEALDEYKKLKASFCDQSIMLEQLLLNE